jgi:hypothetical protein
MKNSELLSAALNLPGLITRIEIAISICNPLIGRSFVTENM